MPTEPIDYTLDLSTIVPNLVKGLLENLPEHSISMQCTGWDYDKGEFSFLDEDGTEYELTQRMAELGFMQLIKEMIAGEWPGLSASEGPLDPCHWDAPAIDALVQMSVLGEVIYG